MTRRASKVDTNHAAVRDDLRRLGWTVEDRSHIGGGMSDLFVSLGPSMPFAPDVKARGVLNADGWGVEVEVKDKDGKLTPAQQERIWLRTRAPVIVAETAEDVIAGITQIRTALKARSTR